MGCDTNALCLYCSNLEMSCEKKYRGKQHLDNDIEVARKLREKILRNF